MFGKLTACLGINLGLYAGLREASFVAEFDLCSLRDLSAGAVCASHCPLDRGKTDTGADTSGQGEDGKFGEHFGIKRIDKRLTRD